MKDAFMLAIRATADDSELRQTYLLVAWNPECMYAGSEKHDVRLVTNASSTHTHTQSHMVVQEGGAPYVP